MFRTVTSIFLAVWMLGIAIDTQTAHAADTDVFAKLLEQVDKQVCTNPEKLPSFYSSELVIMIDDKRALLQNRVDDYRRMLSEFRSLECKFERKILAGSVGDKVGYVLTDELISVSSKSNDNQDRQHSVCSYSFVKEKGDWKIGLEHCSSLPDYSIRPGEDALYYFHNPVY